MEQYTNKKKEEILNQYKELFNSGKVKSINEFIKRQKELIDLDRELKYPTFYKWTKKRKDIKNLKAEPVQESKNHKSYEDRKEKQKEEEKEEVKKEEEKELELEKRIEEVDRIKTKNPESKENQKKSNKIKEEVKSTFNYNKLYIAGGILIFGFGTVFLLNRNKKKNKEVVKNDVQSRRFEEEQQERRKQSSWGTRYSTAGDY